jgi:hypothetical protein
MASLIWVASFLLDVHGLYAQEKPDTLKQVYMEEVVVKADKIIPKGNHLLLFPSMENKKFGTNALDAISSMDLFLTSINDTSLFSYDRKEVYLLINGVPSTAYELRSYKGDDIKNVEYYTVAPPRYMDLTEGPVVNVIVKKRHSSSFSGYANTSNAVNTGHGTNQIDLTYADSLNQFKLGYLIDYRNVHGISDNSDFTYPNGNQSHYSGDLNYRGEYHKITASYQRFQAKHHFNARLTSIIDPRREYEDRTGTLNFGKTNISGMGEELLKSHSTSLAIDLYYRYLIKKNKLFAVNVINSFGKSDSYSSQDFESENGQSDNDYDVSSRFDNRLYSLTMNSYYTSSLWGGTFDAGLRYDYKRLRQVSNGVRYEPNTTERYFLNAGGSWIWNKSVSFVPAIGLSVLNLSTYAISRHTTSPYLRLYTDWWGKGKAKGTTAQLTLWTRCVPPALGNLAEGISYIDPWLVSTGNSNLKSALRTSANLVLGYFVPNSKNNIHLNITPMYAHNQIGTMLVERDGILTLQPQNISNYWNCEMSLSLTWYPTKWLELSPYFEYYTWDFDTPTQSVRFNYRRVGGRMVVYMNNATLILAANSPTKQYDGDILTRGSAQYSANFQYRIHNWSLGIRCNYLGHHEYDSVSLSSFGYRADKDWGRLHYLTRVTATYSFSVGHSRRQARRLMNEQDINDGLTKFNSPQIAK